MSNKYKYYTFVLCRPHLARRFSRFIYTTTEQSMSEMRKLVTPELENDEYIEMGLWGYWTTFCGGLSMIRK